MTEKFDINNEVYKLSARPCIFERKGERKMFERQVQVHRERLAYLEGLQRKGNLDNIILPPTVLEVMAELEKQQDGQWTLSQIRRDLHNHKESVRKDPSLNDSAAPSYLHPFLRAADSSQIPLVDVGVRSHWFFVKDSTNIHVLYALQALWSNEVPIVDAILRHAAEFLRQIGAIPNGEAHRKDWSPRRFQYGGLFKSFGWESLYETKRVWMKDRSQTGKMEDETLGPRLCWGEKGGANGAAHSIYMVRGLDMHFREQLLAA
ncbi:hypothetical protein BBP40_004833 [Aspergillus hancockii]|nr:hypothetical protein BBP40_004833 [Aspergillus hancockii]